MSNFAIIFDLFGLASELVSHVVVHDVEYCHIVAKIKTHTRRQTSINWKCVIYQIRRKKYIPIWNMLKNARDAIERIISQESKRNVAVKVNKEYNTGAKWQIHNNNKHYKYRERSQNNKNNVKIFKFNVNVRMCMLLSWAALLTNWFQQSNAHTNTHLYGRHTLFSLLHFTYTDIWYMNIRCGFFSLFRCECVRYFFFVHCRFWLFSFHIFLN